MLLMGKMPVQSSSQFISGKRRLLFRYIIIKLDDAYVAGTVAYIEFCAGKDLLDDSRFQDFAVNKFVKEAYVQVMLVKGAVPWACPAAVFKADPVNLLIQRAAVDWF